MSDADPSRQPPSEPCVASGSVGGDLNDEQIAALEQFIARLGGIKNAQFAVELLAEVERAA